MAAEGLGCPLNVRVVFITPSVSRALGGIFEIERCLGRSLAEGAGVTLSVLGLEDRFSTKDLPAWEPVRPRCFRVRGPAAFGFSPGLRRALSNEAGAVAHLHALWMYTSVATMRWSRRHRRPYVVTPNGMLEPWALRNSAWKKKLAAALYERRLLRGAACLQANTAKEASHFRAFGLHNPIAIIPNGIDLSQFDSRPTHNAIEARYPVLENRKRLLFLSRIHPKKGLPHLIRAWAALHSTAATKPKPNHWVLVVAGPDEGGHELEMKALATRLGVCWLDGRDPRSLPQPPQAGQAPSLVFAGPLYGAEKQAALAGADAFVLPSFSEGFSMAVLEAAACSLPVLLTRECNFPELTDAGGGIEMSADVEGSKAGLQRLFSLPDAAREEMGRRGRRLVEQSYTWPVIARQMAAVYRWVLGEGEQPACIVT